MRIAIRADASATLGSGHIRRCLSLAGALRDCGADVTFLSRPIDAVAPALLAQAGDVIWLKGPADPAADAAESAQRLAELAPDWVVVDHYGLAAPWHLALRQHTGALVAVIDDLADRPLAPDVLIDHNLQPAAGAKYADVLQGAPKQLLGPRYALLDAVYSQAARYAFSDAVRSIGIFMGGTDAANASLLALRALRGRLGFRGAIEIATTSGNPNLAALREAAACDTDTRITLDQGDLAAFFARHDLQLGAGGGATWERCCIGAPTLAVIVADNQRPVLLPLQTMGVLRVLTDAPSEAAIAAAARELIEHPALRRSLAERSKALVDGRGAQRVATALLTP